MASIAKISFGVHGLVAAWLVVNGVAHQIGVLWKANAGTLREGASVPSLLTVGAGLLIAGAVHSWTLGGLWAPRPSVVPAFAAVALLALVVGATAAAYGFTFLRGTIALGVLDLVMLTTLAART